jgi:hypothetical protein
MSDNYTKTIHHSLDGLHDVSKQLYSLSNHCYALGLNKLGDRLVFNAETITRMNEAIDKAVGDNITDQYRQAETSSRTMLKAVFAGIELAKTSTPETPKEGDNAEQN